MGYFFIEREKLVNLEYSLDREIIRSNIRSAYSCTTIIRCNTRKYHGLFIVPQPDIDNENHVLLSCLDETILYEGKEFRLGTHQYEGDIHPRGYKYLESYTSDDISIHEYRVGSIRFKREVCCLGKENRMIIRYTADEFTEEDEVTLRLIPFLAFRQVHKLTKANSFADAKPHLIENGLSFCLYEGYTPLYIQASKKVKYVHQPDWYYNVEYFREKERGYDYLEDLMIPGYLEFTLKKGEPLYINISLEETNPFMLSQGFSAESKRLPKVLSMEEVLKHTAKSFIVKQHKKTEIIAGFPWFGRWGRDTFISLPGLMLPNEDLVNFKQVIDTLVLELKGPLFPNIGSTGDSAYNSVDAPFWFFWALQQYAAYSKTQNTIWKEYGEKIKLILNGFKKGTDFSIHMTPEGLIYAGEQGKALTWMDAIVQGVPVTPRIGMPVEINALWYNAMMFSIEMATLAKDEEFINEWQPIAENFPEVFKEVFWDKERGWLADVVNGSYKDFSIRPNMIFAASLPYTPLSDKIRQLVVEKVKSELLTTRGLRSLSAKDPDYVGYYEGSQEQRDKAYHQGTVWPWLIGHFAEAYLKLYGKSGVPFIEQYYKGFEEALFEACIGSISEIYDGNPPHKARGAISQAWSVAEILRMKMLIDQYRIYNDEKRII